MPIYDSVNGVARKVDKMYDGVNGVARQTTKIYDSVDGVARQTFNGNIKPSGWFTFYPNLNNLDIDFCDDFQSSVHCFFPFTSQEGLTYNSIFIINMGTTGYPNYRMYFDEHLGYDPIFNLSDYYGYLYGWKSRYSQSIYLDDLEIGVDISKEDFKFLLTIAYPDESLSEEPKPQLYFIEEGDYTFNDKIVSGGLFPYNPEKPAVSLPVQFNSLSYPQMYFSRFEYYYYMDIIDTHQICYVYPFSAEQESNYWVYLDDYYHDGTDLSGWSEQYKWINLFSGAYVSRSAYEWWTMNTQKGYIY